MNQILYILIVIVILVAIIVIIKKTGSRKFVFVRNLNWQDVFEIWKNNEINEPHWQEYYTEKGFNSWIEWRNKYLEPIKALNKKWKLVKVVDPLKSVPKFHGGPYNGWWKNYYQGENLPEFGKMAEHPRSEDYLKNLPSKTTIIAWNTEIGIVIIEGMHRCAGITKASKENKNIKLDLYMVVADCPLNQIPDFRDKN